MARRLNRTPSSRWARILGWSLGAFAVLLLAAFLGIRIWIDSYLRSAGFRKHLSDRAEGHMRARVDINPVTFDGTQFFCEGFSARGGQEAVFSDLKVEAVRGEFAMPAVWRLIFGDRKFRVETVDVQRVEANFFEERLSLDFPPLRADQKMTEGGKVSVREVKLGWRGGAVNGLGVTGTRSDAGWRITGQGGKVAQKGLPAMDIAALRILFKEPTIYIQEARLREGNGDLTVTGEVIEKEKVDLQLKASRMSVTPWLPEDWRARLHGRLGGEARLILPLRDDSPGGAVVTGNARLTEGVLEALPVLHKIAEFTKTDQFRRLALNQVRADFRWDGRNLEVTNLVVESERLISVTGRFTIINGQVDGTFDVGITPGPLQWLPGSQEKVFTVLRSGYAWTGMRVTGPVDSPREDLSSRLAAAAQAAIVQQVGATATEAVGGAVETVKKGANGVLDLLFGNP